MIVGLKRVQRIRICNNSEKRQYRIVVIPAKLVLDLIGEQGGIFCSWIPAFVGMTGRAGMTEGDKRFVDQAIELFFLVPRKICATLNSPRSRKVFPRFLFSVDS